MGPHGVTLDRRSALLALLRRAGRFGVNVLSRGRRNWHRGSRARQGGQVPRRAVAGALGCHASPEAGGLLACTVTDLLPGGDHVIVLGELTEAEPSPPAPLTYHGRAFGTHTAFDEAASR